MAASVAATFAAVADEARVTRPEKSGFQILAHFAERSTGGLAAYLGGRTAEFAAEGVGEVAVAGKAEVEGKRGKIVRPVGQVFERSAEAQPGQIAMDGYAGSLLKEASEMKGRHRHNAGDFVKRATFSQSAPEVGLGRLGAVCMIGIRSVSAAWARQTVSREGGFQHVGDELKRRHIDPERFERIRFGGHQPLHELVMPPENAGIAGSSDEAEGQFGSVVDRGMEFADDVVEYALRGNDNGPTIAVFGRMADAVGRAL